jgi:alkylhydroperoxidase family enzyme
MLFSPVVGEAVQAVGAAIRYGSELAPRLREIAILELARCRRSEFEWHAHAPIAAAAGLTPADLDALRTGRPLELPADEALARQVVTVLLESGDLDDELFGRAQAQFGASGLSELLTLVGYYELLALSLRVWRTPLPAGAETVFGPDSTPGRSPVGDR